MRDTPFILNRLPNDVTSIAEFMITPGPERDAAIAWARDAICNCRDVSDAELKRACTIILANDADHYFFAWHLRRALMDEDETWDI